MTGAAMGEQTRRKKVLITGAMGNMGRVLALGLRHDYDLRLADIVDPLPEVVGDLDYRRFDLTDPAAMREAAHGMDAIVHMAAHNVEGDWPVILASNIDGTFQMFEAARQEGVRRIVYASSHHVTGFQPRQADPRDAERFRPDSRYAISKVAGEAMGRLYADKHGLSVIAVRIGICRPKPPHRRALAQWLSEPDWLRLARASIEAPDLPFHVVYGVSANDRNHWDDTGARVIGYHPQDNAEDYASELEALLDEDLFEARFQGGAFCAAEFDGDAGRIR